MLNRYKLFVRTSTTKRKQFSEVQKRIIACRQDGYKCVGEKCQGKKILPETWELDHKIPLFKGGSNYYNFKFGQHDDPKNNLQVICPNCHSLKTQYERQEFYATERKEKYKCKPFEIAQNRYHSETNTSRYFPSNSNTPEIIKRFSEKRRKRRDGWFFGRY